MQRAEPKDPEEFISDFYSVEIIQTHTKSMATQDRGI
jgi:hypothetical protein